MTRRLRIPIRVKFMLTFLILVTTVVGLITFTTANLFQADKKAYINGLTSMVALGTAEEARLNLLNPPDKTPELFEAYLPYALALDVENEWSEKFTAILAAASAAPGQPGGYRPRWYSGSRCGNSEVRQRFCRKRRQHHQDRR